VAQRLQGVPTGREAQAQQNLGPESHWAILCDGVETWNAWRRQRRRTPDLSARWLSELGHGSSDDAYDYWLDNIDLSGTKLADGILDDGCIRRASFASADLTRASLVRCNLEDSDMSKSVLIAADFRSSSLDGVDFSGALFGDTQLLRVDLSQTRGLANARHKFGSVVDVGTIEKTRQGLERQPHRRLDVLKFLERCGVPSRYLEF